MMHKQVPTTAAYSPLKLDMWKGYCLWKSRYKRSLIKKYLVECYLECFCHRTSNQNFSTQNLKSNQNLECFCHRTSNQNFSTQNLKSNQNLECFCHRTSKVVNSKHENIRFTMEKSTDARTITFLDVQVELNESGYNTWIWRKPTNTGLLLNFNANCPQTWKSSLIMCLLHRAKNICPNDFLYKQEVKKNYARCFKKMATPTHS